MRVVIRRWRWKFRKIDWRDAIVRVGLGGSVHFR